MARKKTQNPTAFDDVLSQVYGGSDTVVAVTDIDSLDDIDDVVDDDKNNKPVENATEGNKQYEGKEGASTADDDTEIPQDVLDRMNNSADDNSDDDTSDDPTSDDITEADQVGALFEAVGESLGWNMADIDSDQRPSTVDELTQYLTDVVTENSVPHYANDTIRQLDEYVKNGGNFEEFYSRQQQAIDLDSMDMDDESNQKAVVRELLHYNGYTDQQINSKIERYEDADMLAEESKDALDILKDIRQKELDKLSAQQEAAARAQYEQQQQFFNDVTSEINSLTEIRGIHIPKEDRKKLYDYIFRTDANGMSQYQKDFNNNLSRNLIESAYFTMKADSLVQSAKKSGETSATDKLRNLMRHSAKNHSSLDANSEKRKSVVELTRGLF